MSDSCSPQWTHSTLGFCLIWVCYSCPLINDVIQLSSSLSLLLSFFTVSTSHSIHHWNYAWLERNLSLAKHVLLFNKLSSYWAEWTPVLYSISQLDISSYMGVYIYQCDSPLVLLIVIHFLCLFPLITSCKLDSYTSLWFSDIVQLIYGIYFLSELLQSRMTEFKIHPPHYALPISAFSSQFLPHFSLFSSFLSFFPTREVVTSINSESWST